ncbi:unnamed protein product [Sphacelaria rigidula]
MKTTIVIIVSILSASEAFVVPSVVSRGELCRQGSCCQPSCVASLLRCSASSPESESRRSFLSKSAKGVAAAAVAAVTIGSPVVALAAEPDEVKVGEEITSDSGLKYVVTKAGTGAKPNAGDFVKAHYTGWLNGFDDEGVIFDSSRDRGKPFSFRVGKGQVIKAWDEALINMKIGERRRLTVPPELGYGSRGAGRVIPPDATLYFDVELLGVQPV